MFLVMAVYVTPGPAFQHLLQVSNCDAYSSSYEVMKQCVRIWLLLNRLPFFEVGLFPTICHHWALVCVRAVG